MLNTCCASEMTSPPSMINERFEEKEHTFIYFSIFIFTNTDYLVQMCYKGGCSRTNCSYFTNFKRINKHESFFYSFY